MAHTIIFENDLKFKIEDKKSIEDIDSKIYSLTKLWTFEKNKLIPNSLYDIDLEIINTYISHLLYMFLFMLLLLASPEEEA